MKKKKQHSLKLCIYLAVHSLKVLSLSQNSPWARPVWVFRQGSVCGWRSTPAQLTDCSPQCGIFSLLCSVGGIPNDLKNLQLEVSQGKERLSSVLWCNVPLIKCRETLNVFQHIKLSLSVELFFFIALSKDE